MFSSKFPPLTRLSSRLIAISVLAVLLLYTLLMESVSASETVASCAKDSVFNSSPISVPLAGYKLPWRKCRTQYVLQGWGGSTSHNGTQMYYAYDFDLPEGVQVRASRGGTIKFVKSNSTVCGGQSQANNGNYVTIYHGNGNATLYLHLKTVSVTVGQYVSQGTVIGTSGKTGWTANAGGPCIPHLHFQSQPEGGYITNSVPIYFDEYPGQELVAGPTFYQSQNGTGGCPTVPPVQSEPVPESLVPLRDKIQHLKKAASLVTRLF